MADGGQARDRLGVWCGWVLAGAAALTPLLAWLGPLGFAPLMGLVGLLCLPALRLAEEDRPIAVVLLVGLVWAGVSAMWSPRVADELEDSVALKLALQLPLYWAAWCAARRADPLVRRVILQFTAWALALLGLLLVAEAVTGGGVYQTLRQAFYEPIRPDLARKNLAQASFVLALLWPVATAGGVRAGAPAWLALPMIAGLLALAFLFGSDAPVIALALSIVVGLAVWLWPRSGPGAFAAAAAGYFILMPALVLGVRSLGRTLGWQAGIAESWSMRVGYWSHAVDAIAAHPLRGWGLDASRTFSPNIGLHPHNGALQLWLELGVLGAVLAALFWAFSLRWLARDARSLVMAGAAASAAAYLLFGAVSFGVWQEWWLALGALAAVLVALADGDIGHPAPAKRRRTAAKASTPAALSG